MPVSTARRLALVTPASAPRHRATGPAAAALVLASLYKPGTIEDVDDHGHPTWRVVVEDNRHRLVTAWQRYDGTWQVDQEARHPATLDGDDPSIEAADLVDVLDALDGLHVRPLPVLDDAERLDRADLAHPDVRRALDGI